MKATRYISQDNILATETVGQNLFWANNYYKIWIYSDLGQWKDNKTYVNLYTFKQNYKHCAKERNT